MNITLPQDSLRIDQNLYKSLTPLKRKTFSESMLVRRSPFLQCECENSQKSRKIHKINSGTSHKRLKYSENKENQTKNSGDFRKLAVNTKDLKCKEKSLQKCASNTPLKTITTQLTSPDHKIKVETTGIETLTNNNTEFETENWLKLQNDLKNLKLRQNKRQRSEFKIETNEIETKKGYRNNLNQKFEIETKRFENTDFKEKQTIAMRDLVNETNEIETSVCEESNQISGYYSESSLEQSNSILEIDTSTEHSFKCLNNQINPLTNSTFICSEETIENETEVYQTADSSFIANGNETYEVEINKTSRNIETDQNICKNNKDSKNLPPSPKKYPDYRPENFQIPLIIINEIEIIHYGLKTTETEATATKTLTTLKVPAISIQSDYEENKELQKKLVEMKLHKQIEIKDKVMAQLLEIAMAIDFPKLKHLCNLMCYKDNDGSCKKMQMAVQKGNKMEYETGGFFQSIWSVFKYPFGANPNKSEDKEDVESKKKEVIEKGNMEEKLEGKISEVAENIKEDLEKDDAIEVTKDKSDNKVGNSERVILPNYLVKKGSDIKAVKCKPDNKTEKIKITDDIKLETKEQDIEAETKENTENSKNDLVPNDIDKSKDFLENEKKAEDCNKIIESKEEDNSKNLRTEEAETKSKEEKEIDKPNTQLKSEVNKSSENQQQDQKKPKKKKGFFSFFSRKDKTIPKETNKQESKEIDNMEEVLQQLEKEEYEKLTKISQEALKKLDNFMAEKVTEKNVELKTRTKRAGSF